VVVVEVLVVHKQLLLLVVLVEAVKAQELIIQLMLLEQ
jgi:hypothetical protein